MDERKLTVYANCVYGWGKGKTLAEAINNCIMYSRGGIKDSGKGAIKNALELITVWLTDDPNPEFGMHGQVTIHKDYHYIFLGSEHYEACISHGTI